MSAAERPRAGWGTAKAVLQSLWFRLLVTVGLLALVASGIDWDTMVRRIEHGHPAWFAVAILLVILALVVGAWRWWLLLEAAGVHLTARQTGRVFAMSTFAGTFLPTGLGGDVARALLVSREGRVLVRASLSVVLDRVAGFAGLITVAVGGLLVDPGALNGSARQPLLLLTGLCILVGAVVLAVFVRSPALLVRRVPERMHDALRDIRDVTLTCVRQPRIGIPVMLSSIVFQTFAVLTTCALGRTISVDLSFATAAVTVTLVQLTALIPLSIAGFGIREGSYVVLLGSVGINATDATLISLMSVAVLFIASLPGAYLLIRHGTKPVLGAAAA